jgi:hypothetical protein
MQSAHSSLSRTTSAAPLPDRPDAMTFLWDRSAEFDQETARPAPPPGKRWPRRRRAAVISVLAAVIAGSGLTLLTRHHTSHKATVGCMVAAVSGGSDYVITPEQAQNASIIAAIASKMGLPDHATTVALATALVESQLRDLPYGDRDSVGLFQQRPSQGWGTQAQLMDPTYAAAAFYRALAAVPGWETMAVTDAAQQVQRSAAPQAYAAWESEARALAQALTGEIPTGLACRLTGFGGQLPATTALSTAATAQFGSARIGVPLDTKAGWATATWAVAHAYNYHLASVAFAGWEWSPASGRWTQHSGSGTTVVATPAAPTG